MDACPNCDPKTRPLSEDGGSTTRRYRYVKNVVVARPEYVEHAAGQYWCRSCRRRVGPAVTGALPAARFGLVVVMRTAGQHCLTCITISKVVAQLRTARGFDPKPRGLGATWRRLALCLAPD